MTIGNGGGVELKLNGESLGVPGEVGKVVRVKVPKSAKLLRVPKLAKETEADTPVVNPEQDEPDAGGADMEDDGFDN